MLLSKQVTNPCLSWSPCHELVPETPLRHGHAISIDMAFSATLANSRGLITDAEHHRILKLFSRAGLSMDHELFNEEILDQGTQAILKTRDGKLRAAVPSPIGSCTFINDYTDKELHEALSRHKTIMKDYPRQGAGLEAYVDSSDTGYTENKTEVEATIFPTKKTGEVASNGHAVEANGNGTVKGDVRKVTNGTIQESLNGVNGHASGNLVNGQANGHSNGVH